MPRPDHRRLEWLPEYAAGRFATVRVRAQTCTADSCSSSRVVYELCFAGGTAFLRRWPRGARGAVRETAPMPVAEAERVWRDLLYGRAR
ncbi:hypothetical protein AB0K60_19525 [Thermopolyspora sp. NPDC052614]|uniref:hypothetical protein n=1 Tax=Thermopolyspora sp. NPDC052614 TaxID=3155682 RepID=UPI003425FE1C